jgi:protein-S-isoprenylcysteine O-methyltransferase Ste14
MSTASPVEVAAELVTRRPPVDISRLGIVALFTWCAVSNVVAIDRQLSTAEGTGHKLAGTVASLLGLAFCGLVVRAYLRRGRASATDRGVLVWVVAPLATVTPIVVAAVPPATQGVGRDVLVLTLTLAGTAWSVWSLRALATNLSVVPQARAVVTHGPYRWVRHPLYFGEIVALCGLALHVARWFALAVVGLEILLQVYRAQREERLLAGRVPGYADYAARTRRLVPGVW